jgi:hypothetical protein
MGDDPRPLMSDAWGCDSVSIFREVTASTKMLLQTQQSRRPTKTSGFALSPIRAVFLDSNRWVVELMGLQCRCFYPQSDRASIASAQWPASRFFVAMCLVRLKIFDGCCLNHWSACRSGCGLQNRRREWKTAVKQDLAGNYRDGDRRDRHLDFFSPASPLKDAVRTSSARTAILHPKAPRRSERR